ncbi:hypothetical protein AB0F81_50760 [Actinoplanes sp. NPDC024001]|uniref:hypothetical protein n=1 Tax=Actinoplanes sp. NPDC024001 TaxID=3154598 RepID=UPI0033E611AA
MEPNTAARFEALSKVEVAAMRISMARINDAVSRVLTSKFQLGLFDQPYASLARTSVVGSSARREDRRQVADGADPQSPGSRAIRHRSSRAYPAQVVAQTPTFCSTHRPDPVPLPECGPVLRPSGRG